MWKKMSILAVFIILALAGAVYYFLGGFRANKAAVLTVGSATFNVEVASTTLARAQGLSGRSGLGEHDGMFFVFGRPDTYGFWMKDMEFPIDIVWVSHDRVVGFSKNVKPEPKKSVFTLTIYNPPEPVDRVLEIAAGAADANRLKVGDAVSLSPPL